MNNRAVIIVKKKKLYIIVLTRPCASSRLFNNHLYQGNDTNQMDDHIASET